MGKEKSIKLRLGDFTEGAFARAKVHDQKLPSHRVKNATIYTITSDADREHALAILYYMESAPAFWGDDAELVERSAIRRTSASWRAALGLSLHEKLPLPYTALRMNIDKPTDEEAARERAAGIE